MCVHVNQTDVKQPLWEVFSRWAGELLDGSKLEQHLPTPSHHNEFSCTENFLKLQQFTRPFSNFLFPKPQAQRFTAAAETFAARLLWLCGARPAFLLKIKLIIFHYARCWGAGRVEMIK
jgi:hypothetical protein